MPTKSEPAWRMWRQQSRVLSEQAILTFGRRAGHGEPPSADQIAIDKLLAEFRQCSEYQSLDGLLASVAESEAAIADGRQSLDDLQTQLAMVLAGGECPEETERAIEEAKARIAKIERRRQAAVDAIPEARRLAEQAYCQFAGLVSGERMAEAKPRLESVISEIEELVSPLLGEFRAAQKAMADASTAGLPDVNVVLASSNQYGGIPAPKGGPPVPPPMKMPVGTGVAARPQRQSALPKPGDYTMVPVN